MKAPEKVMVEEVWGVITPWKCNNETRYFIDQLKNQSTKQTNHHGSSSSNTPLSFKDELVPGIVLDGNGCLWPESFKDPYS